MYDDWLALEDFFLLGLGLDIAGAISLARGLIIGSDAILSLSVTYVDYNRRAALARANDKVQAKIGVGLLLAGFGAQALGYLVSIGLTSEDLHDGRRVRGGLIALCAGLAVGAATLFLARPRMLKSETFAIACVQTDGRPLAYPDVQALAALASDRWPLEEGESAPGYAQRVFRRQLRAAAPRDFRGIG